MQNGIIQVNSTVSNADKNSVSVNPDVGQEEKKQEEVKEEPRES